jgi:hypothetical protein
MTEWMETWSGNSLVSDRFIDSSNFLGEANLDFFSSAGGESPDVPDFTLGVRLVYAVPTPSSVVLLGLSCVWVGVKRRR